MFQRILLAIAMAVALAAPADARRRTAHSTRVLPAPPAPAPCLQFYLGGQMPAGPAPASVDQRLFCHSFYALTYSTTRRDPVWTSYRLTAAMARSSDGFTRHSRTFAPQPGLSVNEQGAHGNYRHPPFDRGHMTPDNDAPDLATQADTYFVSNIVPQISGFNEGLWSQLEGAVHRLAESEGDVYVVTGPIFGDNRPAMNGIAVPSAIFKAIYVPSRGFALAFVSTNERRTECRIVPVAEVQRQTGFDPFPSLQTAVKAQLPALPPGWGAFPSACHPAGP